MEMNCMCSELSIMSIDYDPLSHLNFCTSYQASEDGREGAGKRHEIFLGNVNNITTLNIQGLKILCCSRMEAIYVP